MMQNKHRSGGSDQCLRGINVRSGCERSSAGGGMVKDGEEDANKTNEVTRRTNTGPLRRRLGAAVK